MKWISIEDKLPEEDVNVLAYDGADVFIAYLSKGDYPIDGYGRLWLVEAYGIHEKEDSRYVVVGITHWSKITKP